MSVGRVHDELRLADLAQATAAAVARCWGFAHPGRFAAAYQRAYGCAPSRTLRHHR